MAERTERTQLRVVGIRADSSRFTGLATNGPVEAAEDMAERARDRGCTNVRLELRTVYLRPGSGIPISATPWVDLDEQTAKPKTTRKEAP